MARKTGQFNAKTEVTWEEKERYNNQRLQEHVEYAYENSSPMRSKLGSVGLKPSHVRLLQDLQQIPITTKDDLLILQTKNPPWAGLLEITAENLERSFKSPGPIYDPQPAFAEYYNNLQSAFHSFRFTKSDVVVNTCGYHMMPAAHIY